MLNNVNLLTAFLLGILSFFSPCVLPLIPSYLCYITGISFEEMSSANSEDIRKNRSLAFWHSVLFVLGLAIVFVVMGASATYLSKLIFQHKNVIVKIAGVLIFLFGLYFTGLINPHFMQAEKRIHLKNRPAGFFGSVLIGMTFGFGWTPCVGPMLGSILLIAATEKTIWSGMLLLFAYALGLGIPFILSALLFNWFLSYSKKILKNINKIVFASGILLMIIGVLMFFNLFDRISQIFAG